MLTVEPIHPLSSNLRRSSHQSDQLFEPESEPEEDEEEAESEGVQPNVSPSSQSNNSSELPRGGGPRPRTPGAPGAPQAQQQRRLHASSHGEELPQGKACVHTHRLSQKHMQKSVHVPCTFRELVYARGCQAAPWQPQ